MQDILKYYDSFDEESRLTGGKGALEFERSCEIIRRRLPPPPAVILDVGGATGTYARSFARQRYEVHLIDASPKHIQRAREIDRGAASPLASITIGDARALDHPDCSVNAVFLFGPLYHLTRREDRLSALREAHRVLRPGGVLSGAAIGRFASLLAAITEGFLADPEFIPILDRDLREGQHRNETTRIERFTTAFFHTPEELSCELEEAGFREIEVLPVEGPGWLAPDIDMRWNDPPWREALLGRLRQVEREPSLIGASPHLMALGSADG